MNGSIRAMASAETCTERHEARKRRETMMLRKYSRHQHAPPSKLKSSLSKNLALLHNLRTGGRPPKSPCPSVINFASGNRLCRVPQRPICEKTGNESISPRRAATSIGFSRGVEQSDGRRKILFSSDDERIYDAAHTNKSKCEMTFLKAPDGRPNLNQKLQRYHGISIDIDNLCYNMRIGSCSVLQVLKIESCPVGLIGIGKILSAARSCKLLNTVYLNSLNGSKNCPITLPSQRDEAAITIAKELATSKTIRHAVLRNNGLSSCFAIELQRIQKEGNFSLINLDVSGNSSFPDSKAVSFWIHLKELRLAYTNLGRGSKGENCFAKLLSEAEHQEASACSSKTSHPLSLLDCAMCGLGEYSSVSIAGLLTCPRLQNLTFLDISFNRLASKVAYQIAESLKYGCLLKVLKGGHNFFGVDGTCALIDACAWKETKIKHLYLENTAPMNKQHVWEKANYLQLVDRPDMICCVVEWPPKKPRRLMCSSSQDTCAPLPTGSFLTYRSRVCDSEGLYDEPVSKLAADYDFKNSNISKLLPKKHQNSVVKLLQLKYLRIHAIFKALCLNHSDAVQSLERLCLKGWKTVVHRILTQISSSSFSSDSDEEEVKTSHGVIAERIFRATKYGAVDNPGPSGFNRVEWSEALVRLAILTFSNDTPPTALSKLLKYGLFKIYHNIKSSDFWRKHHLYNLEDTETLLTKSNYFRRVLLDIFLHYSPCDTALKSPKHLGISQWLSFLKQFKCGVDVIQGQRIFLQSLPLCIELSQYQCGLPAMVLSFSGFLESIVRLAEMLGADDKFSSQYKNLCEYVSLKNNMSQSQKLKDNLTDAVCKGNNVSKEYDRYKDSERGTEEEVPQSGGEPMSALLLLLKYICLRSELVL